MFTPGAHFTYHLKPKVFVSSIETVWNLQKSFGLRRLVKLAQVDVSLCLMAHFYYPCT